MALTNLNDSGIVREAINQAFTRFKTYLTSALGGKQDSLTASQLTAANSGIDSTKVAQIATNATNISNEVTRATNAEALKEDKSNKVTSLSPSSTDAQYPSAKTVYDAIDSSLTEEIPDDFIDTLVGDSDVDFWLFKTNDGVLKQAQNEPITDLTQMLKDKDYDDILLFPDLSSCVSANGFAYPSGIKRVSAKMDLSNCTNIGNLFHQSQSLTYIDEIVLNTTSRITSVGFVFRYTLALKAIGKPLNVSKAVNMYAMFDTAYNMRKLTLIGFGTQPDVNIPYLFAYCNNWGSAYTDNEITITKAEAEQSVIDTFYTFSFDRATAGYTTLDVTIPRNVYDILNNTTNTDTGNTFLADATAKGYTFAIQG